MQDWSGQEWFWLAATGVLALVALGLALALVRVRSSAERVLADTQDETARLRAELAELARRLEQPRVNGGSAAEGVGESSYVITNLGDGRGDGPEGAQPSAPAKIESALFADLVLRETVVKAASLAHGVRRALAPETRNRIRFEMRREIKRSRRQRRAETRIARREWEARQRALLDEDSAA